MPIVTGLLSLPPEEELELPVPHAVTASAVAAPTATTRSAGAVSALRARFPRPFSCTIEAPVPLPGLSQSFATRVRHPVWCPSQVSRASFRRVGDDTLIVTWTRVAHGTDAQRNRLRASGRRGSGGRDGPQRAPGERPASRSASATAPTSAALGSRSETRSSGG